jgi:hypothetical protein
VHQHDRFGAAVGARGKEFQRAPAVGLGAAPAAWAWHLIFLRIRPFQIESVRFELRFCFFEARRVTIHCMAGRETGSTDDAWERHGLFRCGAFIAARSQYSETPPEHLASTVAEAMRRSVVTRHCLSKKIGRRNGACAAWWVCYSSRHLDVAQDDIDVDVLLLQDERSFIYACCFKDAITAVPQVLVDRLADQDLVFVRLLI